MLVELALRPMAPDFLIELPSPLHRRRVDPGFEARWALWLARGRQHDLAVSRHLRHAVLVSFILVLALVGLRLSGGSL